MYNFQVIADRLEKIAGNGEPWQQKVNLAGDALARFNRPDLVMIMLAKVGYLATMGEASYDQQISKWILQTAADFRQMNEQMKAAFAFSNAGDGPVG